MGIQPANFIPVSYVNDNHDSGTFFLNLLIGFVAIAAFYNIYKGRTPAAKKGGKPSDKKSNNWF
jgi:hypothetical protein